MKLYNVNGSAVAVSNLAAFGPVPEDALALKFGDAIEDGRWVSDRQDLARLRRENAPLLYTAEGLEEAR
jgi:hypothetical protein